MPSDDTEEESKLKKELKMNIPLDSPGPPGKIPECVRLERYRQESLGSQAPEPDYLAALIPNISGVLFCNHRHQDAFISPQISCLVLTMLYSFSTLGMVFFCFLLYKINYFFSLPEYSLFAG